MMDGWTEQAVYSANKNSISHKCSSAPKAHANEH